MPRCCVGNRGMVVGGGQLGVFGWGRFRNANGGAEREEFLFYRLWFGHFPWSCVMFYGQQHISRVKYLRQR